MALPALKTASAGATDAGGAWSYTLSTGASGDFVIVQVQQCGTSANNAVTVTSVTNMNALAGTANVMTALAATGYAVGSATAGYQYLFFGRLSSTTAAVITGGNSGADDIYVRAYSFTGVNAGTTLAAVLENVTAGAVVNGAATDQTVTDSSVTTLEEERLALNFICNPNDNTIGPMTGMSGGTWAEAVAEYSSATGTDGMLSLQSAAMTAKGVIDGGSVSLGGATPWSWGNIGFALRPAAMVHTTAGFGREHS